MILPKKRKEIPLSTHPITLSQILRSAKIYLNLSCVFGKNIYPNIQIFFGIVLSMWIY